MAKPKIEPGTLYLLASAMLWSLSGTLSKYIPWSALTVVCFRGIIGGLFQMAVTKTRRIRFTKPILLTAACYTAMSICFMAANKLTTVGATIVLENTSPLYIMLASYLFYRKKPTHLEWVSAAAIFAGILLCTADSLSGSALTGNLLALLAGVFYAGVFFTGRLPGADPMQSTILGNLSLVLLLPFALADPTLLYPEANAVPLSLAVGAMVCVGIFQVGLAYYCFSKALPTVPALRANLITMIEPVLSPVWALIILGERMSPTAILGGAVVIGAVTVYNILATGQTAR